MNPAIEDGVLAIIAFNNNVHETKISLEVPALKMGRIQNGLIDLPLSLSFQWKGYSLMFMYRRGEDTINAAVRPNCTG